MKDEASRTIYNKDELPFISVIVPMHNEGKVIDKKLKNCLELDYPNNKWEIIVADDFSTDDGCSIVQKNVDKYDRISLVKNQYKRGKVGGLKTSFNAAKGDMIVLTDADVVLEKDALYKCAHHLMPEDVGAVCGIHSSNKKKDESLFIHEDVYRKIYTKLRLWESSLDSAPVFHGQFMAFKKEFTKIILNTNTFAEDTDFAIKIRKEGFKTKYMADSTFYEIPPTDFDDFQQQKIRRGIGLVQIFWSHRKLLFNPRYGLFGLLVFPLEFMLNAMQPILFLAWYFLFVMLFFNIHSTLGILFVVLSILLFRTKFLKTYLFLNKVQILSIINVLRGRLSPAWNSERNN